MTVPPIERSPEIPPSSSGVTPNLGDYDEARRGFSWELARGALDGLPGGRGLNIAHEAVDRHALVTGAADVALRFLRADGGTRSITYPELRTLTNRFANVLRGLGVGKTERVFTLLGRVPELHIAVLGTLKNGSVCSPLFSAFGPEPIRARLALGDARVLVTSAELYARKVEALRPQLPGLAHVLLTDVPAGAGPAGSRSLAVLMNAASDDFEIPPTAPEDMALLHFTSGTTGKPKGAVHVHEAIVAHDATGKLALDLHPGDVFWCTADPGWVTGTSYGIIAPLSNGVTVLVDEEEFDAERWYRVLEEQKVTVWYTAPTAVRMLMRAGPELPKKFDLSRLRLIASVGEPLNPEAVIWGRKVLGRAIHDNWWQTETGGIMIANFASQPIRPGSMGRPLPGIEAAIVGRAEDGRVEEIEAPGVEGELAIRVGTLEGSPRSPATGSGGQSPPTPTRPRPGWPSMFRGYLGDDERYKKCFAGGFYLTGDLARRDADGYYWFVGRADDVIKSSGHLIGPFEVESALIEHPAVAEAGVIGKPDPMAFEIVKAFVSLKPGFEPGDQLRRELLGFARKRLGAAVAPRELAFLPSLPRTRSGKIMRRLLRARELGLPEGDTSTLEGSA